MASTRLDGRLNLLQLGRLCATFSMSLLMMPAREVDEQREIEYFRISVVRFLSILTRRVIAARPGTGRLIDRVVGHQLWMEHVRRYCVPSQTSSSVWPATNAGSLVMSPSVDRLQPRPLTLIEQAGER